MARNWVLLLSLVVHRPPVSDKKVFHILLYFLITHHIQLYPLKKGYNIQKNIHLYTNIFPKHAVNMQIRQNQRPWVEVDCSS